MKYLICIFTLFMVVKSSAQDFEKGIFLFKLKSENAKPTSIKAIGKFTDNDKLNQILKKHLVNSYEQAYPFAKNQELLKIYRVKIEGVDADFKKELDVNAFDLVTEIERIPVPIPCYEPSDYMYYLTLHDPSNGWLWHLTKIQADKAWDITKSNSNIKIGVIDSDFDIIHPDLSSKISPNYDPMTLVVHSARGFSHGTITSSFAAAHTDGGGQLASVGFNSNIVAYTSDNGVAKALHASNVMDADVITISWYYYCGGTATPTETQMIKEILDNGTIIVASAGNGPIQCNGGPIGPFSPLVDSRIICVTSTDINDKHQYFNNGVEVTHSGYPSVSICAPGYSVMGATSTINADGTVNTWPYYGFWGGTSFSTPQVAGVCALMKSINPCLTPSLAKSIIQSTADPVTDANLYPGMLGAGRINAYNCVMLAGTKLVTGNISVSNTYSGGYAVNMNNATIQNNANITFQARNEINIVGPFEVQLGSSANFIIDANAVNSCN